MINISHFNWFRFIEKEKSIYSTETLDNIRFSKWILNIYSWILCYLSWTLQPLSSVQTKTRETDRENNINLCSFSKYLWIQTASQYHWWIRNILFDGRTKWRPRLREIDARHGQWNSSRASKKKKKKKKQSCRIRVIWNELTHRKHENAISMLYARVGLWAHSIFGRVNRGRRNANKCRCRYAMMNCYNCLFDACIASCWILR